MHESTRARARTCHSNRWLTQRLSPAVVAVQREIEMKGIPTVLITSVRSVAATCVPAAALSEGIQDRK